MTRNKRVNVIPHVTMGDGSGPSTPIALTEVARFQPKDV